MSLRAGAALGLGLQAALLVASLWASPYIATQDGPDRIAACDYAGALDEGDEWLAARLEVGTPVSGQAFFRLCRAIRAYTDWPLAYRLSLSVIVLTGWAALVTLARTAAGAAAPGPLLVLALCFPWCLYMGFLDFYWVSALGVGVLALAMHRGLETARHRWGVGLALAVLVLGHSFAGMFSVAMVAGWYLYGGAAVPRPWRRRLLDLAILVGPATVAALPVVWGAFGGSAFASSRMASPPGYFAFDRKLLDLWRHQAGVSAVARGAVALLAFAATLFALRACPRTARPRRYLGWVSLLSLVLFVLAPLSLGRWEFFNDRFLWPGAVLAVAAWSPDAAWARRYGAALAFVISGAVTAGVFAHHRAPGRAVEDVWRGLSLPRKDNVRRLPIVLASGTGAVPDVAPLANMGRLYSLGGHGLDPFLWADEALLDGVLFRAPVSELFPPSPPRFPRNLFRCVPGSECPSPRRTSERLAALAARFDEVVLYDPEALVDLGAFRDFGLGETGRDQALSIWAPRRCRLTINGAKDLGEVRLARGEAGWFQKEWRLRGPQDTATLDVACGRAHLSWRGAGRCEGQLGGEGLALRLSAPQTRVSCSASSSTP